MDLRRRAGGAWLTVAVVAVLLSAAEPVLAVLAALASLLAGRHMSRAWPAVVALAATLFAEVAALVVSPAVFPFASTLAAVAVFAGMVPWLAGLAWRQSVALTRAGWERAAQLERERRLIAAQARLRERTRIAQDMHDVLGNELNLLALRAGALSMSRELADGPRAAAGDLRAGAARAVERLGEVVGVLRESEPEPGVPSVATLVREATDAGMRVRLTVVDAGSPRSDAASFPPAGAAPSPDVAAFAPQVVSLSSDAAAIGVVALPSDAPSSSPDAAADVASFHPGVAALSPDAAAFSPGTAADVVSLSLDAASLQPEAAAFPPGAALLSPEAAATGPASLPPSPAVLSPGIAASSLNAAAPSPDAAAPPAGSPAQPLAESSAPRDEIVARVVREALTNAAKHAPGSAVDVDIRASGAGTLVEIRNGRAARPAAPSATGGSGLAALDERIRLLGGALRAGLAEDGWVVQVRLPPATDRHALGPDPGGAVVSGEVVDIGGDAQLNPWLDGTAASAGGPGRPSRRRVVLLALLPLAVFALLTGGLAGWSWQAAGDALLDAETFASLRIGQDRTEIAPLLPAEQAPNPPPAPVPEGARCEHYAITRDPLDSRAGDAYRLCFRGSTLITLDTLRW